MNPVGAGPAVRAVLLGLFREAGSDGIARPACPRCRRRCSSSSGPAPPASEYFNALARVELRVPVVDDDAQPRGGVRFPEVEAPLGRPEPVALPPCGTASIADVCGNFGGWAGVHAGRAPSPGTADVDGYSARYAAAYDAMVDRRLRDARPTATPRSPRPGAAFTSLLAPTGP